jgi:hypothetical protein
MASRSRSLPVGCCCPATPPPGSEPAELWMVRRRSTVRFRKRALFRRIIRTLGCCMGVIPGAKGLRLDRTLQAAEVAEFRPDSLMLGRLGKPPSMRRTATEAPPRGDCLVRRSSSILRLARLSVGCSAYRGPAPRINCCRELRSRQRFALRDLARCEPTNAGANGLCLPGRVTVRYLRPGPLTTVEAFSRIFRDDSGVRDG